MPEARHVGGRPDRRWATRIQQSCALGDPQLMKAVRSSAEQQGPTHLRHSVFQISRRKRSFESDLAIRR